MTKSRREPTTLSKKKRLLIIVAFTVILGIVLCGIFVVPKMVARAKDKAFRDSLEDTIFTYDGGLAMEPTFVDGDKYIVYPFNDEWYLEQGLLIGFYSKNYLEDKKDTDITLLRVVGVPGDVLFYDEATGIFYYNEVPSAYLIKHYDHSYGLNVFDEVDDTPEFGFEWGLGEYTVPENHVFVMGDNHTESIDSRHFGCVAFDDVVFILRDWVYFAAEDLTNTDTV